MNNEDYEMAAKVRDEISSVKNEKIFQIYVPSSFAYSNTHSLVCLQKFYQM